MMKARNKTTKERIEKTVQEGMLDLLLASQFSAWAQPGGGEYFQRPGMEIWQWSEQKMYKGGCKLLPPPYLGTPIPGHQQHSPVNVEISG